MKDFLSQITGNSGGPEQANIDIIQLLNKAKKLRDEVDKTAPNSEERKQKVTELLQLYLTAVESALNGAPEEIRSLLRLISATQIRLDRAVLVSHNIDPKDITFIPLIK